jgi:hypothetical protein
MNSFRSAIFLSLIAVCSFANSITLETAGNGTGMTDGTYYVGLVSLNIDGRLTPGLCIDSLHDVFVGETWSANLLLATDTVALIPFFLTQWNVTPAVFQPALLADAWAFEKLLANGSLDDNILYQHAVWGQLDPRYDGSAIAGNAALDLSSFYVVAGEAGEQTFLVQGSGTFSAKDVQNTPEPGTLFLTGSCLLFLAKLHRK